MKIDKMTWADFSARYCKSQEETPEGLATRLQGQIARYEPDGFFMAEAQLFDSSWFGTVVILPFGPRNTFKTVPDHPFSPRGLASDTSVAIGFIDTKDVPNRFRSKPRTATAGH
jgi:hypothetical protein